MSLISRLAKAAFRISSPKAMQCSHHDRLIARLSQHIADKRILRVIGLLLRSGIMANGLVTPSTEGAVQGRPLSPLLGNIVLDELDKEL